MPTTAAGTVVEIHNSSYTSRYISSNNNHSSNHSSRNTSINNNHSSRNTSINNNHSSGYRSRNTSTNNNHNSRNPSINNNHSSSYSSRNTSIDTNHSRSYSSRNTSSSGESKRLVISLVPVNTTGRIPECQHQSWACRSYLRNASASIYGSHKESPVRTPWPLAIRKSPAYSVSMQPSLGNVATRSKGLKQRVLINMCGSQIPPPPAPRTVSVCVPLYRSLVPWGGD